MIVGRERLFWIATGGFVLAAMLLAVGLAMGVLLGVATGTEGTRSAGFDSYIWRVVRFTLCQAMLSTLLAVGLAIPVARALARHPLFPGRAWLIRLFAVPLGVPAIIAALGLIEIWGRNGIVNVMLASLGLAEPISIYGLSGILLAHVFFNMPLAARLILFEIERSPAEYWRNAAQLGLSPRRIFTLIEWPAVARVLPGVAGLVFMLCTTSFTLVLLLGGGPGATTIEVAIYQSLRFDFDPPRAVRLALLQIALTAVILATMALMSRTDEGGTGGSRARRFDTLGGWRSLTDFAIIAVAAAFVASPLAATLIAGLSADFARLLSESVVRQAIITSILIGLSAGILSLAMAVVIVHARLASARSGRRFASEAYRASLAAVSSLILLVPPVVLGAGWFVLLHGRMDVFQAAPIIVIAINAFMALPFVMKVLEPAYLTHMARTGRLSATLGICGANRLRLIDAPALARPLLTALAFAMALSLGDLGAIALFGSQDVVTLPYLLFQRMGSYRTADAAGLALLLGLFCLTLMVAGTQGRRYPVERPAALP